MYLNDMKSDLDKTSKFKKFRNSINKFIVSICVGGLILMALFYIIPKNQHFIKTSQTIKDLQSSAAVAPTDQAFNDIYNNYAATSLKYISYVNNLIKPKKKEIESAIEFTQNIKLINEGNNVFYQDGSIYKVEANYIHQDAKHKDTTNRIIEDWVQTGNYIGATATYSESTSFNVKFNSKYSDWEQTSTDLKKSNYHREAALSISLPNKSGNNSNNINFSHLKPYQLTTGLYLHGQNSDLPTRYLNQPSLFINAFLQNSDKYNNSVIVVSPALSRQPGRLSLGYSYIVCKEHHYYIYQFAVDHLKYKKKTNSYNRSPIAIYADIPSSSINQHVANYLQGMVFDTFGPEYALKFDPNGDDQNPLNSPHINHYASSLFKWLGTPYFYNIRARKGDKNPDGGEILPFDLYQKVSDSSSNIQLQFPAKVKFQIYLAGGKFNKQKFGVTKRPWENSIGGARFFTPLNKAKGYKNERRSEFTFSWSWNTKTNTSDPIHARNFYYYDYLFAIECGQCITSSSAAYQSSNLSSTSLGHSIDYDTLAHGTSISLYMLMSVTFGANLNYNPKTKTMNPSKKLTIRSNYTLPSYDPTKSLSEFSTGNFKYSLAILIILFLIIGACILFAISKLIFGRKNTIIKTLTDHKMKSVNEVKMRTANGEIDLAKTAEIINLMSVLKMHAVQSNAADEHQKTTL